MKKLLAMLVASMFAAGAAYADDMKKTDTKPAAKTEAQAWCEDRGQACRQDRRQACRQDRCQACRQDRHQDGNEVIALHRSVLA